MHELPAVTEAHPWSRVVTARRATLAIVTVALAAIVLVPEVVRGDFTADDWYLAGNVHFAGVWRTAHIYLQSDHRPLLALYLPVLQWVFGEHARPELAWIAFMHVVLCTCFYCFLRTLGSERLHATAITLLVFLFPFSDASWMYVVGSVGTVAVVLWLLGAIAALHGLRATGRRAWSLHALAVALYVASVLTYELAVVAVLLSGLLYAGRASRRTVLRRWAVDIAAMVPVLLVQTRVVPLVGAHDAHPVTGLSQQLDHARALLSHGGSVLGSSLEPFGSPSYKLLLGIAVAVGLGAWLVRWRLPTSDPARAELGRWLAVAAAACGGVVAAWLVIVPANEYLYEPDYGGVSNRINLFAGLWLCVLAYALAVLLGLLVARSLSLPRGGARVAGLLFAIAIAIGYAHRVETDETNWARAAQIRRADLAAMQRALPSPARRSWLLLLGGPGSTAPGIPTFGDSLDLGGAVRLMYGTARLAAEPIGPLANVICTARAVVPLALLEEPAPYGRAFAIDAGSSRGAVAIRTQSQCLRTFEVH